MLFLEMVGVVFGGVEVEYFVEWGVYIVYDSFFIELCN